MKVVLIFIFFFFLSTFAQDYLHIGFLSPAPVIDGHEDDVYYSWTDISVIDTVYIPPADEDDLSGYFQVGWCGDSLYFFIWITDDVLDTDAPEEWQNDGVEFFFDGNYSRGEIITGINKNKFTIKKQKSSHLRYEQTDFDGIDDLHITIEADEVDVTGITSQDEDLWIGTSCNFAIIPNDYGYDMEVAFDMSDLYLKNAIREWQSFFGFEI